MTALAATLHDPEGRLLVALAARAGHLARYEGVYVAATATTAPAVADLLRSRGVVVLAGDERIGVARRAALGAAAGAGHADVLACDFDRWLHWAGRFPEELAAVPTRLARRRPAAWYACLGRTARAFATHPYVQRVAEAATNYALSLALGRRIDAVAGACWLSREGATLVLQASTEPTNATDGEWPALVFRADPRRLAYVATEGLEFETAEFFAPEIQAAGSTAAWVRSHYDHPGSWRNRLRLATNTVQAACDVLGHRG